MEIRRFLVSEKDINGNTLSVSGSEFLHMTKVLRYKTGYKLVAFTGNGKDYNCTIESIGKDSAVCRVDGITDNDTKLTGITLYQCITRSDRFDFVLQKAVELGVKRIVPVVSEYSTEKDIKTERAERIILEAVKQCGLSEIPELSKVMTFRDAVKEAENGYMFYEKEKENCLRADSVTERDISVIVGAEGGFSESEYGFAKANGIKTLSLGKRILRTETATLTAIVLMNFLSGGMEI